jgi:hypothetical protein
MRQTPAPIALGKSAVNYRSLRKVITDTRAHAPCKSESEPVNGEVSCGSIRLRKCRPTEDACAKVIAVVDGGLVAQGPAFLVVLLDPRVRVIAVQSRGGVGCRHAGAMTTPSPGDERGVASGARRLPDVCALTAFGFDNSMNPVFVSFSVHDRDAGRAVVDALEQAGIAVSTT